MLEHNSRLF